MIRLGQAWMEFSTSNPGLATLMQWTLHAAIIVLAAAALDRLAGRRHAALCRRIWNAGLVALAVLAMLTLTLFPMELSLGVPISRQVAADSIIPPTIVGVEGAPRTATLPTAEEAVRWPIAAVERAATVSQPTAAAGGSDRRQSPATGTAAARLANSWPAIVLGVYLLGLTAWLVWIGSALVRLHLLWAGAGRLTEIESKRVEACASQMSLRKTPRVRSSRKIRTAMTWGVLRPVILVPESFASWADRDQNNCLLHEMAHVAHRDGFWSWWVQLVSAVYWFHPLVQLANRRWQRACEEAADDAVLQTGVAPTAYSRSLLKIAERFSISPTTPVGALSAASSIEARMQRILDPRFRLVNTSRWVASLAGIGLIALACTTVRLESVAAQPPVERSSQPAIASQQDEAESGAEVANEDPPVDEKPADEARPDPFALSLFERFQQIGLEPRPEVPKAIAPDSDVYGYVIDDDGPVAGAVILVREIHLSPSADGKTNRRRIVGRARSDDDGFFEFERLRSPHPQRRLGSYWELLVADSQNRFAFNVTPMPRPGVVRPDRFRIKTNIALPSSKPISLGRVVSASGQPLANVRVFLERLTRIGAGPGGDPFQKEYQPEDPLAPSYQVRLDPLNLRPMVLTDAQGRFAWRVPPGEMLDLIIEREGYYQKRLRVATSERWKTGGRYHDYYRPVVMSPAEVELRELVEISVEVANREKGPAEGGIDMTYGSSEANLGHVVLGKGKTWRTTAESLREYAGQEGQLKLRVDFPLEDGLLSLEDDVVVDDLIASRRLRLEPKRGVQVSGRIVSSSDGAGIAGAQVCWHADSKRIPDHAYTGWSDAEGRWSAVVPRQSGFLSVVGQVTGYELATVDHFNQNDGLQQRFTKPFAYDGGDCAVVDIFVIDPLAKQVVRVVDEQGQAVPEVNVEAGYIKRMVQDGRTYRLYQTLAGRAVTDEQGECELTLACPRWEDGVVNVSLHEHDEIGNLVKSRYGHSTIEPNSAQPLVVVLKEPWRVRGRVAVDGRPASGYLVEVTQRFHDSKWFGRRQGISAVVDQNGWYEMTVAADYDYSVAVSPRSSETPLRFYFLQEPLIKVGPQSYRAPDIIIRSSQMKPMQEFFRDLQ